jgi:hypothetical protein
MQKQASFCLSPLWFWELCLGWQFFKVQVGIQSPDGIHALRGILRRFSDFLKLFTTITTPLWGKCEDETHTPKSGNWESSGTPATSKLDSRGKNTLPWSVLYIVGKVSKCRCRKWPCMSHLDICSTSYGQKKGRESNRQFDSRPQKVGNRPDPGVQHTVGKILRKATSFLHTSSQSEAEPGVMSSQSSGSPNRDSFGTPLWESQE